MKFNFRTWTKKRLYAALHRLEFTKRIIASKIIIHNLLKEKDLRRVYIRNIICHNKKFKADMFKLKVLFPDKISDTFDLFPINGTKSFGNNPI